jgi:hypothetical protein
MIGKNIGIRRARGEFVLATNPDLLFSDNVVSFMASDKLLPDVMYRIDRHDVPAEVPDNVSIDRQLAWCAANVLRIHRRRGSCRYPLCTTPFGTASRLSGGSTSNGGF